MAKRKQSKRPFPHDQATRSWRETIESIAVAVILAFVFRTFVAEAFVIPTGSMASTLMGRHKDLFCAECGYNYRTGASSENYDVAGGPVKVETTVCPLCHHVWKLDLDKLRPNENSFNGDRILVSKFAYDLGSPQRWDVIVFKNPQDAKQNYIKRLVGLPGEAIKIRDGDVYVKPPSGNAFQIARKPNQKLLAMLRLVADTKYRSKTLQEMGWPSPWQRWDVSGPNQLTARMPRRKLAEDGEPIPLQSTGEVAWLRYEHLIPSEVTLGSGTPDWQTIEAGNLPADIEQRPGQLISDFACYNAFGLENRIRDRGMGQVDYHWVGDLALECRAEVESASGELLLQIVEGGIRNTCVIDLATGQATMQLSDGAVEFRDQAGATYTSVTGKTPVTKPGTYQFRLTNLDSEMRLWVNQRQITFDKPATYVSPEERRPEWSVDNPGDAAPLGIGVRDASVNLLRMRVLRDIYYTNTRNQWEGHDYQLASSNLGNLSREDIAAEFSDPEAWAESPLFALEDRLPAIPFEIPDDQYFPLGDNSPQSLDGRYWGGSFINQELMTGKALLVYWPHGWNAPIPWLPNFRRMKLIK